MSYTRNDMKAMSMFDIKVGDIIVNRGKPRWELCEYKGEDLPSVTRNEFVDTKVEVLPSKFILRYFKSPIFVVRSL